MHYKVSFNFCGRAIIVRSINELFDLMRVEMNVQIVYANYGYSRQRDFILDNTSSDSYKSLLDYVSSHLRELRHCSLTYFGVHGWQSTLIIEPYNV